MKFFKKTTRHFFIKTPALLAALLLSACASGDLPPMPSMSSAESKDYPIYQVMSERAPFYLKTSPLSRGGKDSYPYLYLSKGMTVTMLKNDKSYSNVSLINGMQGWMPISVLAPQMSTGETEGASAVSPASNPPAGQNQPAATGARPDSAVKLPSYY